MVVVVVVVVLMRKVIQTAGADIIRFLRIQWTVKWASHCDMGQSL